MSKLLSIKYGPVYYQWEKDDSLLISRDDRPMCVLLSRSEWNFLMLAAQLHGWPIAPPLDMCHPYSMTVTPWEKEDDDKNDGV